MMRPHTRNQCTSETSRRCGECHPKTSNEPTPIAAPAEGNVVARPTALTELPAELIVKILSYMSFKEISYLRPVSRRFNELCATMLNSTFQRLQTQILQRFHQIKGQMPRRESARRNHPLARESDIVETLHMRLTLLQMTFGKHIERKHVCFFAGEILDEVNKIMHYVNITPNLGRAYKITDELFDLSTMAMEYFKEHIEPTLPEISYFGADFLDFTTPYTSPSKRRNTSGLESPGSSRASIAGSSCSEPWSGSVVNLNQPEEVQPNLPATNMVLRKRIRRIRQGMKKYNDELTEVKRELKTHKAKLESQAKQIQDYTLRLEEYDKKFEDSSRKFQNLLTELNKCKTELQYYRSKSSLSTCSNCGFESASGVFSQPSGIDLTQSEDLKTLAHQGVIVDGKEVENSGVGPIRKKSLDDVEKSMESTSGVRKRKSVDDEATQCRKSLRGGSSKRGKKTRST